MTLFEQVGGEDALAPAIDDFYHRMLADPEVADWFEGLDLHQLRSHQRAFLAVGLGGPEAYDGRSMRNAHAGLGITDEAFTRALEHLAAALAAAGAQESVVRQVVRRIELMRAAIVEVR